MFNQFHRIFACLLYDRFLTGNAQKVYRFITIFQVYLSNTRREKGDLMNP